MFSDFFERKDMERIVWIIMNSYRDLFCDPDYNNGEILKGNVLLEAGIFGLLIYSKEKNLDVMNFYEIFIQQINNRAQQKNELSLEEICYIAASLRGDFSRNTKKMGVFFGESARKLGLGVGVFEKHGVISGPALILQGRMTLLRFMSAFGKE
jgi:hypothetical protein